MRVYLDNCCFNRPFDEQTQLRVRLETEAKLRIQHLMRSGVVEYAWSDMLTQEVMDSPFPFRRAKLMEWRNGAAVEVEITDEVVAAAAELMAKGLKNADALHIACAQAVDCDWFFTTDIGILKKVRQCGLTRIANPVEFVVEDEDENRG